MNKQMAVPSNSPANPLPTAFCGSKIVNKSLISNTFLIKRGRFSSAEMRFLPDSREKKRPAPLRMPASPVDAGRLEVVHPVHAAHTAAIRHCRHRPLFGLFGDHRLGRDD